VSAIVKAVGSPPWPFFPSPSPALTNFTLSSSVASIRCCCSARHRSRLYGEVSIGHAALRLGAYAAGVLSSSATRVLWQPVCDAGSPPGGSASSSPRFSRSPLPALRARRYLALVDAGFGEYQIIDYASRTDRSASRFQKPLSSICGPCRFLPSFDMSRARMGATFEFYSRPRFRAAYHSSVNRLVPLAYGRSLPGSSRRQPDPSDCMGRQRYR